MNGILIKMESPVQDKMAGYIVENRKTENIKVVQPDMGKGKRLAICGAGPSLTKYPIEAVDEIWAINSALPYLMDEAQRRDIETRAILPHGVPIVGCAIDQTPLVLVEWTKCATQLPPDVKYLLASSVDPDLVKCLTALGREIVFFHSYVGVEDEIPLYKKWPTTCMAGNGHMASTRMLAVALWAGYERVDLYGCDCCLDGDIAHANGETVNEAYITPDCVDGPIGGLYGKMYRTRIDMLMGAVDLVKKMRSVGGRVRLIGDTLPVNLLGKDDAYLDDICRLADDEFLERLTKQAEP